MSETQDDPQMFENLAMLMDFDMLADDSISPEELDKLDADPKEQKDESAK